MAFIVVFAALGLALAGVGGGLIGGLAAGISLYEARLVALYAFVGVVITGVLSVVEQPLDVSEPIASFVNQHPVATRVGRIAIILLLVSTAALSRRERTMWRVADRPTPIQQDSSDRRPQRDAAAPVAVFALVSGIVLIFVGDTTLRWASVPLLALAVVGAALGVWHRLRPGAGGVRFGRASQATTAPLSPPEDGDHGRDDGIDLPGGSGTPGR